MPVSPCYFCLALKQEYFTHLIAHLNIHHIAHWFKDWMVIVGLWYMNHFKWVLDKWFRVSKGVRDLPGSFQSTTSNIPSGKSLMYFGLFLAAGVFFVFIAFTMFLPVIVLVPQKFAICFTIGCAFIVGSFFALKGPRTQFAHMSSKEVT